ncbi:hypothetical protein AM501_28700 [Aneurinibacillus migulanus]|uniref:Uncharacterized protein n=1 Tax=Aneurinibacillus migulanus TaxID=47500 RepID=A0A0D1W6C7_ANEMI|nr:hypothetical protein [Aneurinibacillus migulanus]KIV52904.1 hypothetical protein TS65_22665 [Aneurinibacillus migulanus]KIV53980.1 hypothetical protein TS64_16815 [Aneurinibacillus migulanus]KON95181.1 hypothetical protein AF333_06505 [Aneurinibacillus migulanus]KPD04989.1 hypothetical protein AM501_28700 [Aneurinibacillus migulanus]MCP1355416.1 hypothetical protein [Aneurinibacillus migulanus]
MKNIYIVAFILIVIVAFILFFRFWKSRKKQDVKLQKELKKNAERIRHRQKQVDKLSAKLQERLDKK